MKLAKKLKAIILTEDSDFGTWAFSLKEEINGVIYIRYKPQEYLEVAETIVRVVNEYNFIISLPLLQRAKYVLEFFKSYKNINIQTMKVQV
ncbi:DUF5615 family PIN-like protein [Persephonella marina]|uniref:DUF5615 family PIN-like protein n=1 Tax=Persephonella marina TaxID=309805 RepID=UPI003CCCB418